MRLGLVAASLVCAFVATEAPAHAAITPVKPAPCWTPVTHPAGLAWAWCQDTKLVVAFADDTKPAPWGRGVYFIYNGVVRASWNSAWNRYWSLLLVVPHPSGAVLSRQTSLVLRASGSSENSSNCPTCVGYDDVAVHIAPVKQLGRIALTIDVDGIAYLGLPKAGTATITHNAGTSVVNLATVYNQASVTYFDGFTSMTATGTPYGTLHMVEDAPLPTLQVQGNAGMGVEGDMDHSYLVSTSFPKPWLTIDFSIATTTQSTSTSTK